MAERKFRRKRKAHVGFFKAQVWWFCLVHARLGFQFIRITSPNENSIWITKQKKKNPNPPPRTQKHCWDAQRHHLTLHMQEERGSSTQEWKSQTPVQLGPNTRCLVTGWEGAGLDELLQLQLETAFPWMDGLEHLQWIQPKMSENWWGLRTVSDDVESNS